MPWPRVSRVEANKEGHFTEVLLGARSGRSARRKRDGLLRDSLRNGTRAFSRAAREAGRAPYQLAREISTRRYWKGARRSRGLAAPWPLSLFVR